MRTYTFSVAVENGAVPAVVIEPDAPERGPALVVIPSIFGPAPDLLKRLSEFAKNALVVVPDPFWRVGDGVVPYEDFETARKEIERQWKGVRGRSRPSRRNRDSAIQERIFDPGQRGR